jgi:tetratricopeptide (TPR) repeat protein
VPSLAEELLKSGAKAVLGWGQKVLDTEATAAAAALYQALSAGKQLTEAVACTYQALIKNKARDWHLLRLYAAGTLPGEIVTPLRSRGRKPASLPSVATQFLDPAGKVKVPTRESFVGRRRQLQNCLRALRGVAPLTPQPWGGQEEGQNLTPLSFGGSGRQCLGVLIHGMGGLGKSSLAARLCDRLPEFERLVWVGRVDEPSLVNKLAAALDSRELREALQDDKEELKFRLRRVFRQLEDEAAKPFLLVLDDFEVNLESRNGGYVLQPEAVTVLEALVWAIRETYTPHRLILTCRYDFESTHLQHFYKQPLEALRGADLRKKCDRLSAFDSKSQVDEALQTQAKRLADGNPRLLEWLDKILQNSTVDQAAILNRLEADPVELREQVLAEALLEQMDQPMREMLSRGLVFELPVPSEALAAVCEGIPHLGQQINRAVALGLLEVSPDESLRVPRILPLKLPEDTKGLYGKAAKTLNQAWRVKTGGYLTEEQCIEIHRLALLGREAVIATETSSALSARWHQQSRFREVVNICRTTLEIIEDFSILNNLARSERQLGDTDSAIKHYKRALKVCPTTNKLGKATIKNNLAVIYRQTGQIKQARHLNQKPLKILTDIGGSGELIAILIERARLYTLKGRLNEAISIYQNCLELSRNVVEDSQSEVIQHQATILHNLANIYLIQEQFYKAIPLYRRSLELKEYIGDIQGYSVTLNSLAFMYTTQGQFDRAIPLYKYSLELKEHIGDLQGKATILHNLAHIYWTQGQSDEAITLYKQALEINDRTRDVEGNAITLSMLGQLLADEKGDFDTAQNYLQQSLEIFQSLQSPNAETVRQIIARVQQMRDEIS